jgi:2-succinyl-6-hydroxy-2,4-cyclohexadiene-1-carboxylate synthase
MTRLVLVHGFTQTASSWSGIVQRLAGHDVITPDIVPRGDLWQTAESLAAYGPRTFVGYSMGGRLALHLALQRPDVVERLVVLGATGGIDDDEERAARRTSDEALAQSIETDGVDAFLERWLSQPMFANVPRGDERQRNPEVLMASLRALGTGTQEPLWSRLHELAMPVLVLAGARDEKFVALGQRLAVTIGDNARFEVVPDAGHAAHLEQPHAFVALLH